MKEPLDLGNITTLIGEPTTMDVCAYSRDGNEPHTFIVLAYSPGQVLQTVCQHCLLLSSFGIGGEEIDPVNLEGVERVN